MDLHNPSEHQIDGRSFPMEAHFVHRSEAGELAVIGLMIKGGGRDPLFEAFMAKAPVRKTEKDVLPDFDPTGLITDVNDVLRYRGSLTSPPCTENVTWSILTDPLVVSDAALLAFNTLFPKNSRPIQPLHRRFVLSD
jgi:carbonic anhydrase